jgi:hypothetical protein
MRWSRAWLRDISTNWRWIGRLLPSRVTGRCVRLARGRDPWSVAAGVLEWRGRWCDATAPISLIAALSLPKRELPPLPEGEGHIYGNVVLLQCEGKRSGFECFDRVLMGNASPEQYMYNGWCKSRNLDLYV